MKTIELTYPHHLNWQELPATVVAIGFFDGIHKGHQKVIQTAIDLANKMEMESGVITFLPHPSVVLKKDSHAKYITPIDEKKEILQNMGVDRLYIISFTVSLSKLSPEAFIDHYISGLRIKHLVAGFDFTYGYKGKGSMKTIGDHANGQFTYTTIEKQTKDDEKISSSAIRKLLEKGEIEKCNQLLGRPLTCRGKVVEGDKRGRTIGYPTANIQISDDYQLPKVGVYAVTVRYDRKTFNGMANLGVKPTFNKEITKPSLEVHLFDYKKEIYGEELIVEWHQFIREEKKFNGIDELVDQLKHDEQEIRSILN